MLQFSQKTTQNTEDQYPILKKAKCTILSHPMEIMVIFWASYATDHCANHKNYRYVNTSVYNIQQDENFIYAISEKEFNHNQKFHTDQAIEIFMHKIELKLNAIRASI